MTVGYPIANETVAIHQTAEGGYLITAGGNSIETEGYFLRFLELADGTRSTEEISAAFTRELGPLFGPMLADRAMRSAIASEACAILPTCAPARGGVRRITGSVDSYQPLHATFEIIETCNFTCTHCYYSSSPLKRGRVSLTEAKRILDMLAERGVLAVELTGGECTVHPDFLSILRHASETFGIVAIISNGYLLGTRESLLAETASYPNVAVQISIDGMEESHDTWRRHKGSFRAATRAARELSRRGRTVRMASVISEENAHEVKDLFLLAESLGVSAVAFTPVASLGRGCNVSEPGLGARQLVEKIEAALAEFAGHPLLAQPSLARAIGRGRPAQNCGAGSRTYAIDYDGNVRACNFSRDSKRFGNLMSDPYELIFGQTANHMFRNAPSPGGEECQGCNYFHYCRGCFVKAFMTSENEFPECPWRKKWFPDMPLSLDANRRPLDRRSAPSLVEPHTPKLNACGCQNDACRSSAH